jgi:oligoribonuclease NrnB/cAMP/cGMP phosphodiesterase (DHH superfamily)
MAALIVKNFIEMNGETCETTPVNYNEPMPDVSGQTVFIVDFSYSKEVIEEARKTAISIYMCDHHVGAAKEWGGYGRYILDEVLREGADPVYPDAESVLKCKAIVKFVENMSGAKLIWTEIFEGVSEFLAEEGTAEETHESVLMLTNKRLIEVVNRVDDRDRWVFQYPDTNDYRAALEAIPFTFEAWNKFILKDSDEEFNAALAKAKCHNEKNELIAQDIARHVEMITLGGYQIPAVNCPASHASRVGEIIGKEHPFSLTYSVDSKLIYCSLRSNTLTGIDVSEFAKRFSGGGHRHASGFRLTTDKLFDLLSGKL